MSTLSPDLLREVARRFGTPVYVYDAAVVRRQLSALRSFDRVRYAQKARPNIHIQRRPTLYGAYHDIRLLPPTGNESARAVTPTVVAGPLCESGDVFTQDGASNVLERPLPRAEVGDLLVIGDAGAYGASMGSNYNSRPHAPEVLVDDGEIRLIRRRQTTAELLALESV